MWVNRKASNSKGQQGDSIMTANHQGRTMSTNMKLVVAFVLGITLSVAVSIIADINTVDSEVGRFQISTTAPAQSSMIFYVVMDTRSGRIVHRGKMKTGDFDRVPTRQD